MAAMEVHTVITIFLGVAALLAGWLS